MSKSVNVVIILGRLTRDPEVRTTSNGQNVALMNVALNRSFKDPNGEWKEITDFIDVVAWSHLADQVQKALFKGSQVSVTGRLASRSFEKDGKKITKVEVIASNVIFLDPRKDRDDFAPINLDNVEI